MTLIQADNVDQSVRAQAARLSLQRGDSLGLAWIGRQPQGSAPRIHPKTAHDFILTRGEFARSIDLDFGGAPFDATLRDAGAARERAYRDGDKR